MLGSRELGVGVGFEFSVGGPCSSPTVWRNTPETTMSKLLSSKGSLLTSPSLEIRSAGFERERASWASKASEIRSVGAGADRSR
jgi:hypothetical protein